MRIRVVLLLSVTFLGVLCAAERKDIAYYDADFPKTGNLEYLKERCKLDLHTPDGKKGFPTLIWLHGGGITRGDKHFPNGIDRKMIAVAGVNYRLSGDRAQCPDYLYDTAAAIAWVLKHIEEYGGDSSMVYVAGHSAGGYLCAMAALAPEYLHAFGAESKQLAGFLPISGQMTTHFQILNERRQKDPATPQILLDEFAPIARASKNAPPLILIVGDSNIEWPARVEENQLLEARLRRNFNDRNVRCFAFASFDHGTVCAPGVAVINNHIRDALKQKEQRAKEQK